MIGLTNFHKLFTKITQLHRSSSLILLPLFSEKKIGIKKKENLFLISKTKNLDVKK